MTTPAAANYYLAQHLLEQEGKPYAVFNPHNKPVESLPVIFGFNNGDAMACFQPIANTGILKIDIISKRIAGKLIRVIESHKKK